MKRRNGNDREDHPADPEPPAAPEPGPDEEKGAAEFIRLHGQLEAA